MLFKSPIFSQASGSIAGTTFSRNRGGMYTRARKIPTNPNTANQVMVRTYLGTAVSAWSNLLSEIQRDSWRTYGDNTPVTNRIGDETRLTGQQQFIRSFVAFSRAGLTPVLTAPTIFNTGEPVVGTYDSVPDENNVIGFTANLTDAVASFMAPASDDGHTVVGIGPPINPGANYYGGRSNHLTAIDFTAADTDAALPVNRSDYASQWGGIVDDTRRGFVFRNLFDDGRVSQQTKLILPIINAI